MAADFVRFRPVLGPVRPEYPPSVLATSLPMEMLRWDASQSIKQNRKSLSWIKRLTYIMYSEIKVPSSKLKNPLE